MLIKFNEKPLIIGCLLGLTIWVGYLTFKQRAVPSEKVVVESRPVVVHEVYEVRHAPRPVYYYPPYYPTHFEYVHRKAIKHHHPRAGFSFSVRAPL